VIKTSPQPTHRFTAELVADCLDGGNNKKAVQEADRLLKKQKDFPCAKVCSELQYDTRGAINDDAV